MKNIFTLIAVALLALAVKAEMIDGHEYVDLGLPSGTLWATCNVGADTPEGYGDYFAWGETAPKESYTWQTYRWCNGYFNTMTKYCTSSDYGSIDDKTELDPEDDAAYVNWGSSWRIPTTEQQQELRNECTWTWTERNGVSGKLVTGPNGNTIFLPAAGDIISTRSTKLVCTAGIGRARSAQTTIRSKARTTVMSPSSWASIQRPWVGAATTALVGLPSVLL